MTFEEALVILEQLMKENEEVLLRLKDGDSYDTYDVQIEKVD